ncbi:MAG TPA: MMPL family transporter, partial [Pyrinomonadaceae bacterium]
GGTRDDGLRVWVTGPGGLQGDFLDVFENIDGVLVLATGLIVAVVLLITYRSPLLVLLPLLAVGAAEITSRALVVLLAKPGGGYGRAAVAAKLLGCTGCHGVLGDPAGGNIQVEIKNGVLNVNQLSGSREATDLTLRFRHDPATGRFQLVGEERSDYDRAAGGGTGTSTNYLTGVRVAKTTTVGRGGRESTTSRTTRVPRTRRFIEDVDYENQ